MCAGNYLPMSVTWSFKLKSWLVTERERIVALLNEYWEL